MTEPCPFCTLLRSPQRDATFIAEFEHSVAFLDYDQESYVGRTLLILKQHHDHLHCTPIALQQAVAVEMTRLTTALLTTFGGIRANHLSLGNQVAHLHWHIVPRYPGDLNEGYAPQHNPSSQRLGDDEYKQLAARIRQTLKMNAV